MLKKGVLAVLFGLSAISIPTAAFAHDDWGHHRVSHNHRYAGDYGSYGNGAHRSYGYPGYGRPAVFISGGHDHHHEHGHGYYSHSYDGGGHGYAHNNGHGGGHEDGYRSGYGGSHGDGDHRYGGNGQNHH